MAAAPTVKTHDLDVPRIGYVHSWQRTQDEGWVRAAFDHFGVPYTYFSDIKLRDGNLRAKYDVIVYPHVGGTAQQQVNGLAGSEPVPYKKSELTPNLGAQDSADDIRGGMGMEGLLALVKFVREGGTLLVEGSTSVIFPEYGITSGITVESPAQLFARGSIMRGVFADRKSPIAYGYDAQVPVYFNQDPVLQVGGGFGGFGGFGGGGAAVPASARTPRRWRRACRCRRSGAGAGDAEARAPAGRRDGAVPSDGARSSASPSTSRGRASCCASRRTRTTCCCQARSPAARRSPTARRSSMRRSARATS